MTQSYGFKANRVDPSTKRCMVNLASFRHGDGKVLSVGEDVHVLHHLSILCIGIPPGLMPPKRCDDVPLRTVAGHLECLECHAMEWHASCAWCTPQFHLLCPVLCVCRVIKNRILVLSFKWRRPLETLGKLRLLQFAIYVFRQIIRKLLKLVCVYMLNPTYSREPDCFFYKQVLCPTEGVLTRLAHHTKDAHILG